MQQAMTEQMPDAVRVEAQFDLQASREEVLERLRNQMTFAEKALAAMLLANGGALVALFTFIGNTVGKADAPLKLDASLLWMGFASFATGVVLVLATHLFAFLSQFSFYNQAGEEMWRHQRSLRSGLQDIDMSKELAHNNRGNAFMITAIGLLVLSLLCFIVGSGLALAGVLPS
jgi:hypothetical protein